MRWKERHGRTGYILHCLCGGMVVPTAVRTRRTTFTRGGQLKEIRVFDADLQTGKVKIAFKGTFSGANRFLKDARHIVDSLNL